MTYFVIPYEDIAPLLKLDEVFLNLMKYFKY